MQGKLKYLLVVLFAGSLFYNNYFVDRIDFIWLLTSFLVSLLSSIALIILFSSESIRFLLVTAIVIRFLLLFSTPNLSDDFYRFYWDGNLMVEGINPYSEKPFEVKDQNPLFTENNEEILDRMNSPNYYSVYTPINQFFFWVAAFFSGGSLFGFIITYKLIILLGELLLMRYLYLLFQKWKIPLLYYFLIILNPLLIVETVGNMHIEVWMLAGILMMTYYFSMNRYQEGSLGLLLAISVKLTPVLLLLLVLIKYWRKRRVIIGVLLAGGVINFLFLLPFENISHFLASIDLYFHNFQFNAAFYGWIKQLLELIQIDNSMWLTGTIMGVMSILLVLFVSIVKRKDHFLEGALWVYVVYVLCSSTIHPWYILPIIVFGITQGYLFPLVWAITAFISYHAYASFPYGDEKWLTGILYLLLIGIIYIEGIKKEKLLGKTLTSWSNDRERVKY